MQPPLSLGDGQGIGGQGEMIHANENITRTQQGSYRVGMDRLSGRVTGQRIGRDVALRLEMRRLMRVGIQRYAIRAPCHHFCEGAFERRRALVGQAMHQIHVNRVKVKLAGVMEQAG